MFTVYFRIAGLLLFFAFGSLYLSFLLRELSLGHVEQTLNKTPRKGFARLKRGQEISYPLRTSYFYSYTGFHNGQNYTILEQVPPKLYLFFQEGKNVEVLLHESPSGEIFGKLRDNPYSYGKKFTFLSHLTLAASILGLLLYITSILIKRTQERQKAQK